MTRGKLAIKLPDAEGRFVKVRGRSLTTITNLPEVKGDLNNLIANFPTIAMLLVCNIMITEGIGRGVLVCFECCLIVL
jgi:hypothetical protein